MGSFFVYKNLRIFLVKTFNPCVFDVFKKIMKVFRNVIIFFRKFI